MDLIVSNIFKPNKMNSIQNVTVNYPTLTLVNIYIYIYIYIYPIQTFPFYALLHFLQNWPKLHGSLSLLVGFPQPFGLSHKIIVYLHAAFNICLKVFLFSGVFLFPFYLSFKTNWVTKTIISSFLFCFSVLGRAKVPVDGVHVKNMSPIFLANIVIPHWYRMFFSKCSLKE